MGLCAGFQRNDVCDIRTLGFYTLIVQDCRNALKMAFAVLFALLRLRAMAFFLWPADFTHLAAFTENLTASRFQTVCIRHSNTVSRCSTAMPTIRTILMTHLGLGLLFAFHFIANHRQLPCALVSTR